jgi:predicted Zn-ribbon and HTH transcriptional regulator
METIKIIETKDIPPLPQAKCQRCEHIWILRKLNPVTCPKCKSPYWNKPRRKPKQ